MKNMPTTFHSFYFPRVFFLFMTIGMIMTSCGDDNYNLDNIDKTSCQYSALNSCAYVNLFLDFDIGDFSGSWDPIYNGRGDIYVGFHSYDEDIVRSDYNFDGKKLTYSGAQQGVYFDGVVYSVKFDMVAFFSDDFQKIESLTVNHEVSDDYREENTHFELNNIGFYTCSDEAPNIYAEFEKSIQKIDLDDVVEFYSNGSFYDKDQEENYSFSFSLDKDNFEEVVNFSISFSDI